MRGSDERTGALGLEVRYERCDRHADIPSGVLYCNRRRVRRDVPTLAVCRTRETERRPVQSWPDRLPSLVPQRRLKRL